MNFDPTNKIILQRQYKRIVYKSTKKKVEKNKWLQVYNRKIIIKKKKKKKFYTRPD